jgi:hypothetical protein
MYDDKIRTEEREAQEIKYNKWSRISEEQF